LLFFSQKYFKNSVKNWVATNAPLYNTCCYSFLGPVKKGENTKKTKKLYSKENKKNNSSEKSMLEHLENCQKLVEEVQK